MAKFCKYCGDPITEGEAFCDNCGKPIEGAPPRLPATPSPLGLASRVTALPQPGEFAVDLPEMPSLPSAVSAVKGFWKGGLAFPLVSGLLAGGVSIPLLNRLPSPWSLIVGILVGVALFVKSWKGANRK